ncbi:hypothetical protein Esti_001519 [Eimeria stiedai]
MTELSLFRPQLTVNDTMTSAHQQPPSLPAAEEEYSFSGTEVLLAEAAGVTDSLKRVQRVCFSRCCCRAGDKREKKRSSGHTSEPQLQVWEKACSDRCISKHFQTHALVGQELQRLLGVDKERAKHEEK